jgi:hypothetical protein
MNSISIGAVLFLLVSTALQRLQTPTPTSPVSGVPSDSAATAGRAGVFPGRTPVYRINLRVHNGQSALLADDLRASLEEMNFIWWSQAGICFEIVSTKDSTTAADGFDIWFVPDVPDPPGVNGVYKGDHDIWSRDYPRLSPAPNPVTHRSARTSAHELGHGLTLSHYNGYSDSATDLMSSGTLGWQLNDSQIQAARTRAQRKAITDTTPANCAAAQIN